MEASERHEEKIKRAERKAKKEIVKFYLIFPLFFLIIFFLFPFISPYFSPQINKLSCWTAGIIGFILDLFGMHPNISGPVVALNNFSITVVGECTGLIEMLIFLAAVMVYPARYKKKIEGLLLGIPLLYIFNIIRMLFIMIISNWNPKTFDFMHVYFWQVAGILIIGGMWLFWIEKIVKYERETRDIHS